MLGIDTQFTTLAEAEHALLDLGRQVALPADAMVCSHEVRDGAPHYAFSIALAERAGPELVEVILDQFPGQAAGIGCAADHDAADDYLARRLLGPAGAAAPGVRQAIAEVLGRHGGRAVTFPGSRQLAGTLPVGQAIGGSALDRLAVLGGAPVPAEDLLVTRDFVRPRWSNGELVLAVLPAGQRLVAPFEVPNPTPCCAGHVADRESAS